MRFVPWTITGLFWIFISCSTVIAATSTVEALKETQFLLNAGWTVKVKEQIEQALSNEAFLSPDELASWLELSVEMIINRKNAASNLELETAEQRLRRSLTLRQQPPIDKAKLSNTLLLAANMRLVMGDDEHARTQAENLLSQADKEDKFTQAKCLLLIGHLDYRQSRFEQSAQQLTKASNLLKDLNTIDSKSLSLVIRFRLAMAYDALNQINNASRIFTEVSKETRQLVGENSPVTLSRTLTAAWLQWGAGEYESALTNYRSVLPYKEVLRTNLPSHYVSFLLQFGRILHTLGDPSQAQEPLKQALLFDEGYNSERIHITAELLSRIYLTKGDLSPALALLKQNLQRMDDPKSTGAERLVAQATYGEILHIQGNFQEARQELEQNLALREKKGLPPFFVASSMDAPDRVLGQVDLLEGRLEQARRRLEQAWKTRVEALGSTHPETILTAELLAEVLAAQGEYSRAEQLALQAEQAGLKHLQVTMRALPEREAITYAERRPQGLGLLLSLTASGKAKDVTLIWQLAMAGRGAVINGVLARQRALGGRQDTQVAQLQKAWRDAAAVYARLLINGDKESQGLLTQARETMEATEHKLTAAAPHSVEKAPPTLAALQQALPVDTALVSYVRYSPSTVAQRKLAEAYVAFVVRKTGAPQVVPLGQAALVDARVQGWRGRAGRAPANAQAEQDTRQAGVALREAVWDPVSVALKDTAQVMIVPDGQLLLVNFAGLPVDETTYLVETAPLLHQLNDERELLLPRPPQRSGSLLALGGVDFNAGRGTSSSSTFPFLEGTAQEVKEITELWQKGNSKTLPTLALMGAAATKTAFEQQATNHQVVHLATHGFVWNSKLTATTNPQARGLSTIPQWNSPTNAAASLHTAGLALAGANRNLEQGILTATEVATLNLQQTNWVVLSACDTGLGNLAASEGMLGLRRAFRSAGAKSLVLSLWEADDAATREWMSALYRARLQQQQTTAQAVQSASRTVLAARRAQHTSTHPYYWATFIATGEWR